MHDGCITIRINLNVYIQSLLNSSHLRKSFILIELNHSYIFVII